MAKLPRMTLGRTGMEITALGFGAMELRGAPRGPEISDETADRVLNAVLDAGINYIDTSPDYGKSEEHIGRAIAHRRGEYFLASKCGCIVGTPPSAPANQPNPHIFTAENVRAGIEQSLRRMKTDYLDLVQFHGSPSREQLEKDGGLEAALQCQREGKARFVGMSGTLPNLVEQIEMGVFDAFQIPYSAVQREHEAVIASASSGGAGIVIRGGAARGAPTDWARRGSRLVPEDAKDRWEKAKLDDLLDGMSRMEFTLRFTLSNPDLDTTIVGTANVEHLRNNVTSAAKGPLPAGVYEEAKRRLASV
jgi:aryl-alcohol dehydrogenase-like predicted oxidoreductase